MDIFKFRFILFLMLIGLYTPHFHAQVVNIENKRIYDDTSGWSGNVEASFSAQQTKDLLYAVNFKHLIQYKTRKHYYLIMSDLRYSGGRIVYANSGMAHARYAYRIKDGPWKWESYAQIQYNQLLLQKSRSLVGSGLRWKFYDQKESKFFAGSSVFFEYEEIQAEPTDVFNRTFRWSNYLSWFINRPHYAFTAATYYQPSLADFRDYRISGQYTYLFKLKKRIDFKFELTGFYDSKPPETVRDFTFSSTFGIVLRLR